MMSCWVFVIPPLALVVLVVAVLARLVVLLVVGEGPTPWGSASRPASGWDADTSRCGPLDQPRVQEGASDDGPSDDGADDGGARAVSDAVEQLLRSLPQLALGGEDEPIPDDVARRLDALFDGVERRGPEK